MIFTAGQIRAIHDQLTEHRDVPAPPRDVLRAVAALIGQDRASALICGLQSDQDTTRWHVVGLLESGGLFTVDAVGDESSWTFDNYKDVDGQVQVQLSASIRSLSDVASLVLTCATGYDQGRAASYDPRRADRSWDVTTAWEICWRDGSPALVLPTRTDATNGEQAAADTIVDKVRQVLAAR